MLSTAPIAVQTIRSLASRLEPLEAQGDAGAGEALHDPGLRHARARAARRTATVLTSGRADGSQPEPRP